MQGFESLTVYYGIGGSFMTKFNSINTENKDAVLREMQNRMLMTPPFPVMEVPLNDYLKEDIVEYMLGKVKEHYGVETNHEALDLWNRYKLEVLENE